MPDQGGAHADRTHQVGGDAVDRQIVVDPYRGLVRQHDAGIVEEHIHDLAPFELKVEAQSGRRSPNIGRALRDSALVASS
jgi:hypothetical protein